jgi:hypothetical protein
MFSSLLSPKDILLFLAWRRKRFHFLFLLLIQLLHLLVHNCLERTNRNFLLILQRLERNGYGANRVKVGRPHSYRRRGAISLSTFRDSIFEMTGLSEKEFLFIFEGTAFQISAPRFSFSSRATRKCATVLTSSIRLLASLTFLRHHPSRNILQRIFQVHWKTLWEDRKHVLPIVANFLLQQSAIRWISDSEHFPSWNQAKMVLDATAHFRNRVHPGHAHYYRGDKHNTFVLGQITCDFAGSRLFSLDLLRGHNNDQGFSLFFLYFFLIDLFFLLGTFNTTIRDKIERNLTRILGDGGYSHSLVVTQSFVHPSLVKTLQFLRGVVEIIFGLVHVWKGATDRFREMPGDQIICLLIVYEIIARRLQECPIRPRLLYDFLVHPTPIASATEISMFEDFLQTCQKDIDILNVCEVREREKVSKVVNEEVDERESE